MRDFIVGKDYFIHQIDEVVIRNSYVMEFYGMDGVLGMNFITINDDSANVVSFILTSYNKQEGRGNVYKCIYNDKS